MGPVMFVTVQSHFVKIHWENSCAVTAKIAWQYVILPLMSAMIQVGLKLTFSLILTLNPLLRTVTIANLGQKTSRSVMSWMHSRGFQYHYALKIVFQTHLVLFCKRTILRL